MMAADGDSPDKIQGRNYQSRQVTVLASKLIQISAPQVCLMIPLSV
jgi:hypothetical protein